MRAVAKYDFHRGCITLGNLVYPLVTIFYEILVFIFENS